ncbi:hypothetical protein J437_LFUL003386 [Ladona fulva]|uniref:G-protein coupled receptors family 1 profile domain-containing protein n=1 Tax=Ladona fulva TaxID=123851 RepID=A0A8K0NWK8_LADFU|nr:hypothetical protein J437_LFUL003386 [Ladona fulva]
MASADAISTASADGADVQSGRGGRGHHGSGHNTTPQQKPRDPEREKRRIARKKEKRATLILGLIMGSFIACWLPFFFLYILTPMCPICHIPSSAFSTAFWLGYMNSALNPNDKHIPADDNQKFLIKNLRIINLSYSDC